jgi:hypothetical protein
MNLGLNRTARMSGALSVVHKPGLPPHGYYHGPAGRWLGLAGLPKNTAMKYRLRTAWFELMLRFRLGYLGLTRGLFQGEGILGVGRLHATHRNGLTGELTHLGLLSTRLITDNGVTYLRDDFNNSAQDITNMNFHGAGTGTVGRGPDGLCSSDREYHGPEPG